jgi:hypothetical protein
LAIDLENACGHPHVFFQAMGRGTVFHQGSAEPDQIPLALKQLSDVNRDSDFLFKLGLCKATSRSFNGVTAARSLENTNGR